MNEFEGSPKTWPPLGMPTGSVRAILTLILVAVVITRVVRGDDFTGESDQGLQNQGLLWIETLLIALSHYFTSRRFVELPPDVLRHLEDDGVIERERNPLFLPKNSIRVLIIGAFGWLAYYLYSTGRLFDHHAASLMALMAAFLLGAAARRVNRWWHRGRVQSSGTMGDLKALLVLIAMLSVAIPEFLGSPELLHPMVHRIALGLMLFYFGSR